VSRPTFGTNAICRRQIQIGCNDEPVMKNGKRRSNMPTDRTQRKNIRLPNYDYSSEGAYFVTICTDRKEKILCHYTMSKMEGDAPIFHLTPIGRTVDDMIRLIPGIDKYVIMPNHVLLIVFNDDNETSLAKDPILQIEPHPQAGPLHLAVRLL
jgi:hypothetical protein